MPNIETFNSKQPAPRPDNAGEQAYEIEGRHIDADYSAAGNEIGGAVARVGAQIDQQDALAQTAALVKGAADIDIQTQQDLKNAQTTGDPHDPDASKAFLDAHMDAWDKLGEGITNDKARAVYDRMVADYRIGTSRSYIDYQSQAAANDVASNFDSGVTQRSNSAFGAPETTQAQIDAITAAAPGLPAEHRSQVLQKSINTIADSGADGIVQKLVNNPNATPQDAQTAKDYLADPANPFFKNLSPGKFAELNDKLDHIKDTQGVVASTIANQAFGDLNTQVRETGSATSIANAQKLIDQTVGRTPAETQVQKAKMQRDLDASTAYGTTINSAGVRYMSQNDLSNAITTAQNDANAAAPNDIAKAQEKVQALTDFQKQRDAAFSADQVGYVTKNDPVVNARFAQWQQNQTPENFQAFVQSSVATQQHLYPSRPPQYVSKEVEGTIGSALNGALNSKEGPAAVGAALTQYAQNAGPYWSSIATQLRRDKVISGSVGVGAELYGSPATQALGETVIRASALSSADLELKYGIKSDKAAAAVSSAMKPLMATMANMPQGDRLIADYRDAATKAVQYGGDPNAAPEIVSKMLTDRYDIADTTIRLPKSLGLDASRISDGARVLQSSIGKRDLVLPPDFSAHGITPDRYASQISDTGKWYTNETNTGALLYDEDGHNVQELKNGKAVPVEVKWGDMGVAADTTLGRRAFKGIAGAVDSVLGGQ